MPITNRRHVSISRIVSYYARPSSYTSGGVNTSRQQWMQALSEAGIPVVVLDAKRGYHQRLVTGDDIVFRTLSHLGHGRQTMVPVGLGKLLKRGDLVYLHEGWTTSNIIAAIVCRIHRVPFVVMPHGVYAPRIVRTLKLWRFRRFIEARVLAAAAAVHVFFPSEETEVAEISPRAATFSSTTGFRPSDFQWSADAQQPYLSWVGRYDVLHKGIDHLLTALALLPEETRPRIRMIGPDYNGNKRKVLQLVHELGLDESVEISGATDSGGVLQHIAKSRGFVHVPRWEAFGRTIVEALSINAPVVLGNGAHIASKLEGVAYIVPAGDISAIADALQALWRGEINASRGSRWVRDNLSWPATARQTIGRLENEGLVFDLKGRHD